MGEPGFFALFLAVGGIGAALLLGPIGQAVGRMIGGSSKKEGLTTGEMAAERIAELEQRIGEVEATCAARVAELEERVDFAERLLAQPASERRLAPAPDAEPR